MYVIVWSNHGESVVPREVRVEAIYDTAEQARAHLEEAAALGISGYLSMVRVDDHAAAKALEIKPRSGNDQMWDKTEAALDRAAYEADTA